MSTVIAPIQHHSLRRPGSSSTLLSQRMPAIDTEGGFDIAVIESTMILWALDPRKQKPVKRALRRGGMIIKRIPDIFNFIPDRLALTLCIQVYNIIVEDKRQILSLVRYNSDLLEFDEKIREHFQKTKVVLPPLDTTSSKQPNLKRRSFRNLLTALPSLKPKHSNSEKVEQYLRRCALDSTIGRSSLFRDFFTPQRDEDCSTAKERVQSYMQMHATAWMNEQQEDRKQKQKQKQKASIQIEDRSDNYMPDSSNSSAIVLETLTKMHAEKSSPSAAVRSYATSMEASMENTANSLVSSLSSEERDTPSRASTPSRKVTIQDFQILKVLGKGCMGKVILVRQYRTSRLFALKAISKQFVVMHREVEHAKSEREILARIGQISHPFLIKLYHSFQDVSQLFLVFDYHVGGDMATQLAKWYKFSPARCRLYAAEIVLGIQELHRLGILYRDLKPENILLGADGHIVLTDFGLSKQFLPHTRLSDQRTTTFCGTAEYLAPEILRGDEYSFAVDFWSLGTLLYEMITGVPPFWAENHSDMYNRVLDDTLEFPPNFDTVTADFISGLLHRVPKDRLGAGPYGPQEIRLHPYFAGLDWSDVYHKRIKPEYIPTFESETDVSNFDDSFIAMTPRFSMASEGELLTQSVQGDFDGYSYTGASMHFDDSHNDTDSYDEQQPYEQMFTGPHDSQVGNLESFYPSYIPEANRDSPIDPWAAQITSTPTPEDISDAEYSSDSQYMDWYRKRSSTLMATSIGSHERYPQTTRNSSNATIENQRRSSRPPPPPVTPDERHRVSPFSMAREAGNQGTSYEATTSINGYSEIRTMLAQHRDILEDNMSMESLTIDDRSMYNTTPIPFREASKNKRGSTTPLNTPTLRRTKDMFARQ